MTASWDIRVRKSNSTAPFFIEVPVPTIDLCLLPIFVLLKETHGLFLVCNKMH